MVTTQPGKLPTYTPDPNVNLSNYDDSDRTRFLHVGSQFVKARLEASRAYYAYVGIRSGTSSTHESFPYTEYKNLDGEYALIDGDTDFPQATGAPTSGNGHVILVGYPTQVTTSVIYLYSPTFLDFYELFNVSYSHNEIDYFDADVSSVTYIFSGGVYKFSINLTSSITGRHFKIDAHHTTTTSATYTSSSTSLSVNSASEFPSEWLSMNDIYIYGELESAGPLGQTEHNAYMTYTGKTGSSFTGVTFSEAPVGTVKSGALITTLFSFGDKISEIDIVGITEPVLQFWSKGTGTQGTSKTLQHDFYYDVIYDKDSDSYLSLRYNSDLNGTAGPGFLDSDGFNDNSFGSGFDPIRWTESTTDSNFQRNSSSGTLDYFNSSAPGRLITNYYLDGDFTSEISVGFNEITSSGTRVYYQAVEDSTNNLVVSMGFSGPYISPYSAPLGNWESVHIWESSNTSAGAAFVRSLRVDTRWMPNGNETYQFTFDSTNDVWTVISGSGGYLPDLEPGVRYQNGPLDLSIVHSSTPANGSQIVLASNLIQDSLPSYGQQWDWKLGLAKTGNSVKCQYDDGGGTLTDWVTVIDSTDRDFNIELYADGASGDIDLVMDDFEVSGTSLFSSIPVLSVETVNSAGNVVQVAGLSDSDGYVIKRLDLFNQSTSYVNHVNGKIQLATDGISTGDVYIKFGTDIYKYAKSSFPLDLDTGSGAITVASGVIPELTAESFAFNSYSMAGLCYVEYDDVRSGTYLKTVDTTTLSGTDYEVFLDVSSADYPWAWDIDNYDTLYYIDGVAEKFYDVDEEDVAFCNVTSIEKIMAAGTSATSTVTATVLNAYGQPLSAKTVSFTVTDGAGSVSPSTACTTATGTASTTYTVGSSVGITTIQAAASDIAC